MRKKVRFKLNEDTFKSMVGIFTIVFLALVFIV